MGVSSSSAVAIFQWNCDFLLFAFFYGLTIFPNCFLKVRKQYVENYATQKFVADWLLKKFTLVNNATTRSRATTISCKSGSVHFCALLLWPSYFSHKNHTKEAKFFTNCGDSFDRFWGDGEEKKLQLLLHRRSSSLDQNSLHIITTGNSGHRLAGLLPSGTSEVLVCLKLSIHLSTRNVWSAAWSRRGVTIFCLKLIYAKQKKSDTIPPKGSYSVGLYRPHWQAKKMTLFAQHESLLLQL